MDSHRSTSITDGVCVWMTLLLHSRHAVEPQDRHNIVYCIVFRAKSCFFSCIIVKAVSLSFFLLLFRQLNREFHLLKVPILEQEEDASNVISQSVLCVRSSVCSSVRSSVREDHHVSPHDVQKWLTLDSLHPFILSNLLFYRWFSLRHTNKIGIEMPKSWLSWEVKMFTSYILAFDHLLNEAYWMMRHKTSSKQTWDTSSSQPRIVLLVNWFFSFFWISSSSSSLHNTFKDENDVNGSFYLQNLLSKKNTRSNVKIWEETRHECNHTIVRKKQVGWQRTTTKLNWQNLFATITCFHSLFTQEWDCKWSSSHKWCVLLVYRILYNSRWTKNDHFDRYFSCSRDWTCKRHYCHHAISETKETISVTSFV